MRPSWLIAAGVAFAALAALFALAGQRRPQSAVAVRDVREFLFAETDSLDHALAVLGHTARSGAAHPASLRDAFRWSRRAYKRLEGAMEFYAPAYAAALNSRRQEVDDDDAPPPRTLSPRGFPALEDELWGGRLEPDSAWAAVVGMRAVVAKWRGIIASLQPTDAQAIELARQELARASTLGIAGFDTPRTHDAAREGADALDGTVALIGGDSVRTTWASASAYLRAHPDFETLNRLAFIAVYAEPAARAVDGVRRAAGVVPVQIKRGWRFDAPSVFGADAFDPTAYAPAHAPAPTAALIERGRRLFSDPRLSGTGTRSCSSCHVPGRAFTDGASRAARLDGKGFVARHTPTLINAALQPAQFDDERASSLEEQALRVLMSPTEMAGRDTSSAVRFALAAFVRTLTALDSRFDRAARGDTLAMTALERDGFRLFMGKAACGTCHFAPLFSGNTPPLYLSSDVEVIGTPVSPGSPARLDPDSGRGGIDRVPAHVRAFKTPTLRNSARSAPYMHNGAFQTLDEVLEFYNRGGGRGAGARIDNQTLSPDSLHLSMGERKAIIAFIGALNDSPRNR